MTSSSPHGNGPQVGSLLVQQETAADHIKERTERNLPLDLLKEKILGNLFFLKSMRTNLAFDSAMKRLGGDVSHVDFPETFSSCTPSPGTMNYPWK